MEVNILENILFCIPQKKENHTILEQHEGSFLRELCL